MLLQHCKTPCSECPFRKDSLPGYLGGWSTIETFQASVNDDSFDCHLTREDHSEFRKECAGRMLFVSALGKKFRDISLEETRLSVIKNVSSEIKENILSYKEFKEHHGKIE